MSPAADLLGQPLSQARARFPQLIVVEHDPQSGDPNARTTATDPLGGFELLVDDAGQVDTVFVHRNDPIIEGEPFSFRSSRKALRRLLGEPESAGEEGVFDYIGPQGCWDRYLFATHAVHFQFQYGTSAVELITFMTLEMARRVTGD